MDALKSKETSDNAYLVFSILALILVVVGFAFTPSLGTIGKGLVQLIRHHSLSDSDYLQIGGFGPSFVNSGLLVFCVLIVYKMTNTEIEGNQIAAMFMVLGYSFYSKTLFNVWPHVIGTFLNAIVNKKPLNSVSALAWYSTAIAPITSVLSFATPVLNPGSPKAITVGISFGLLAGYLVGELADHVATLHKGAILFNGGYTAGIVGFLIFSIMKAIGLGHGPYTDGIYTSGQNVLISKVLFGLFLYLIIAGLLNKGLENYKELFTKTYKSGNFVKQFGLGASLVNMGVLGIVATIYVWLTPHGQLNGPVISGIWTVAGFAASGMTVLSILPVMLGVYVNSFITGGIAGLAERQSFAIAGAAKTSSRSMLVATMFGCGLSPLTAMYGPLVTFIAASLHVLIVPNTGVLHGWMSTYNNGFAIGLSTTFFMTILQKFSNKK